MNENNPSCFRFGVGYSCPICKSVKLIKSGITSNGKQRYKCNKCPSKRFITNYTYKACLPNINSQIILFTKEGLGIRSTARILLISTTTLLRRIVSIAKNIPQPIISKGKVYEVAFLLSE